MFIEDFWLGFASGVSLAGVMGFLFQLIRLSPKKVNSFFGPQKVTVNTSQSPLQVFAGCLTGSLGLLLALLLILVAIYGLWRLG